MNYLTWAALPPRLSGLSFQNIFRHNGRATVEVLGRMKQ